MKPVKNFSEKINNERHTKLYTKDVPEAFNMHVDSAGWLWIETNRNSSIRNCIRIEFLWETERVRVHIIPVGAGLKHKKEVFRKITSDEFTTYDRFQLWVCEVIRWYYQELKG